MSVAVRRAVLDDCAALFGLIAEHALFERSVATLTQADLQAVLECDAPPVTILVAAQDGDLVGFAALTFDFALWRARRWAHLDCLFVREASRGRGLGTILLASAVDHARKFGADRMEWQTPDWNEPAIAFYRRAGAQQTAKVRFMLPSTLGGTEDNAVQSSPVSSH